MTIKLGGVLALFFLFRTSGTAQTWQLVWSDEFNGQSIEKTNWNFVIGGNGWGNNELEYYTNHPENAKVENGNLLIIARKEYLGGRNYTSARLKTEHLHNFLYGKIEARIKMPVGQGLWPAFWMVGQDSSIGGEIDIMEHINSENKVYGTMHWNNFGKDTSSGGSTTCDVTAFHVYSVTWDQYAIRWLLDGNQYYQGNITYAMNGTEEFHFPFFIFLNLAVGGSWPRNPNSATPFPDTMYVDYVRVYQQNTTGVTEETEGQIPKHFSLSQNYPNPFNPSTNISFALPTTSFVTLKIFDVLGRAISTIVSEQLYAGKHTFKWNAANVPSGVYFYQLRTGSFSETKKLILLR